MHTQKSHPIYIHSFYSNLNISHKSFYIFSLFTSWFEEQDPFKILLSLEWEWRLTCIYEIQFLFKCLFKKKILVNGRCIFTCGPYEKYWSPIWELNHLCGVHYFILIDCFTTEIKIAHCHKRSRNAQMPIF